MLGHRDAASAGFPFRPNADQQAQVFWDFDPRSSQATDLDFPDTDDFRFAHWSNSADGSTRCDFSPDFAKKFPRLYGYIALVEEAKMSKTQRPDINSRSSANSPSGSRILGSQRLGAATFFYGFERTARISSRLGPGPLSSDR